MRKLWPTILTLVAVAGVFGTLVGLPPTNPWRAPLSIVCILLISVGIVITLVCWLVRPAPWAVLPGCKELGIDRIHPSGEGGPRMSHHLANARQIRVMAVTAVSLLHHQKPHFLRALRHGATIKLLVAAPESPFVRDLEEAESNARLGNITRELEVVEGLLREFLAEAKLPSGGARGHILVGRYSSHLRSSLIACDDKWGWLTLSLPPKRAMHSCSVELGPTRGGLLTDAVAHFDRVWAIAERRKEVLELAEG